MWAIELLENTKPQILFIVSKSRFVFLHADLCLVRRISVLWPLQQWVIACTLCLQAIYTSPKSRHFGWKCCHVLCAGCRNMESVSFQASLVSLIMCKPKINEPALCMWKKSAVFGYFCTNTSQILTEVRELLCHKLISFCRGCLKKLGDYSLRVPVSLQCEKSLIAAVWATSSDELPGAGWDESPRDGPRGEFWGIRSGCTGWSRKPAFTALGKVSFSGSTQSFLASSGR